MQVMPEKLYGGIKRRYMSHLSTGLQQALDNAHDSKHHLVGMKIDKAKAFDMLVPAVTVLLFLAYGIPPSLTNVLHSLYLKMKRFLSYQTFTSPRPTTASNGLLQGCSLSILGMNLRMATWVLMLRPLAGLHVRAFLDDAYLWASYDRRVVLSQASQITRMWDELTGQRQNDEKCQIFSTSAAGRKDLKQLFPVMKMVHSVEVLGSFLQTTLRKDYQWPETKTKKIIADILAIGNLPCSVAIKEHLIASKAIPQLSFAPALGMIPKRDLNDVQSAITQIIWRNRPGGPGG